MSQPTPDPSQAPPPQGSPVPAYGPPGSQPPPGYGPSPAAPAPGAQPPPGYGPPGGYPAQPGPAASTMAASTWWALLAVVATALAVSIPEDGSNDWKSIQVWAGFAVVAALATLAPTARANLKLSAERAWQVALGGAVALGAFWVLFVLPDIGRNVSFAATIGVAAAGLAVASAPGRPSSMGGATGETGEGGTWW